MDGKCRQPQKGQLRCFGLKKLKLITETDCALIFVHGHCLMKLSLRSMPQVTELIICPHCKGRKTSPAFVTIKTGCSFQEVDCFTCKGAGFITRDHSDRIIKGEGIRLERIKRGLSLRQEALRLGIKPIKLARLERGE